jgi:hypothetical protein
MAIDFLSSIDLNKNELQNGVIHVLATAPSNPVEGQIYYNSTDNRIYFYDGTTFVDASGDIKSVQTTTSDQLTITDPNGPNPSLAIVTGVVTNSGTALATGDQIYDFVYGIAQEVTINGTANEVEVSTTGGSAAGKFGPSDTITVGLPNDVTVGNDLTVTNDLSVNGNVNLGNATSDTVTIAGNLTVNGTTTTVNSNTVEIGDSIITLNSDESGAPSQDAGIEVERGTGANRSLIWDESDTDWKIQQSGGTYERISTYADSVEDVTVTETGASGVTVTETLSGTDNRIKTYDIAVNLDDLRYKASIGDGSTTAIAVTHNLGTEDVIVQLFDNSTKETVYADVTRNTVNQVTVTFASAPATNAIRVLIQKL